MENQKQEYDEMVNELIKDFRKTIPKEEESLCADYKKFLYKLIEFLISKNTPKKEIIETIKSYANYIETLDIQSKKREVAEDDSFAKINEISSHIFNVAKKILYEENVDVDFDPDEVKTEIIRLLDMVKDFNKEQASKLVSETLVDMSYILKTSECMSLRIAQELRIKKASEEYEKKINNAEER